MKKKITDIYTLVYKQRNCIQPKVFSYTSLTEVNKAKQMVERNNGTILYDENGRFKDVLTIEWCHVIDSKLIENIEK